MENKENKSVISSLFTQAELDKLNFSAEEIEAIEEVEEAGQALSLLPDSEKEMDAFFARVEKEFPLNKSFDETFNHYQELMQKDPEFIGKIVVVSALLDEVQQVPPPKTEKISLDEINAENQLKAKAEQKQKFAAIDAVLKNMK